jgi:histidinol-phosphate phosphatase family protein
VFLDRDGVVDALVLDPTTGLAESPLRIADVRLLPGAAEAIAQMRRAGFVVVCVTNQPAAAKGLAQVHELYEVHRRVTDLVAEAGAVFDDARWCLHHPEGTVARLSGPCPCRKPAPGLLLWAAQDLDLDVPASGMIGDTDADVGAGVAAGCRTILVETPDSVHKRSATGSPTHRVPDVSAAVGIVVRGGSGGAQRR